MKAPIRNLVSRSNENPCQEQDDNTFWLHHHKKIAGHCGLRSAISYIILLRFRIKCGMTAGTIMRFRIGVRNDCAFYSPPLEGWLTKEDGVVFINGWCRHQPPNCRHCGLRSAILSIILMRFCVKPIMIANTSLHSPPIIIVISDCRKRSHCSSHKMYLHPYLKE